MQLSVLCDLLVRTYMSYIYYYYTIATAFVSVHITPWSDMLFLIARNFLCKISQKYCLLISRRTSANWLPETDFLFGGDGHKTLQKNTYPDSYYISFDKIGPKLLQKLPQHLLVSVAQVDSCWHFKEQLHWSFKNLGRGDPVCVVFFIVLASAYTPVFSRPPYCVVVCRDIIWFNVLV